MRLALLYLLLFSLPLQTRTLVFAGANEYQSFFLYASDIFAALLFVHWLFSQSLREHWHQAYQHRSLLIPGGILLVWLALSSALSLQPRVGFLGTLKFAEYMWIFYYVSLLPARTFLYASMVFLASAALQSVIALGQFFTQHSVGLTLLGENLLSPTLPGVAKLDMPQKVIRAYGTLPHPNVLAAFLVSAIIILLQLLTGKHALPSFYKKILWLCLPLFALALLVTFSRVAIAALFSLLVVWVWSTTYKRLLYPTALFFLCFILFSALFFPYVKTRTHIQLKGQEISYRIFYVQSAFKAIRSYPLQGVGLRQFTSFQQKRINESGLPNYANQPVHNIYLLFIAETGLVGLFIFYWFLHNLFYPLYQSLSLRASIPYLILPAALFLLGSFDHYLMSFQQGMLLFWVALAYYVNFFRMNIV